jgi:hypothetical protein
VEQLLKAAFRRKRAHERAIQQLLGNLRSDSAGDVNATVCERRERHVAGEGAIRRRENVERPHRHLVVLAQRAFGDRLRGVA